MAATGAWPYDPPEPEKTSYPTLAVELPPLREAPSTRSARAIVVAGVVGVLIGGLATWLLASALVSDPEPLPITQRVFPEVVLGLEREDLAARDAGDTGTAEQLTTGFAQQVANFSFAHGGEGAMMAYGGRFTLTIINASQALPVPTEGRPDAVTDSPILISLDSDEVSCVFQPQLGLYESAVLDAPADLTASGETICVLNDAKRNLSLRLASGVPGDANRTATDFDRALRRIHADLTS